MIRTTSLILTAAAAIIPFTSFQAAPAEAARLCQPGYVWRDAFDGDAKCVTPQERDFAKRQNANAENVHMVNYATGLFFQDSPTTWREEAGSSRNTTTPR